MALIKEQLMAPRYKVIADYPKSIYPVGTIINAAGRSEDLLYCDWEGPRCRDYPHLFQKLEWHEDRNAGELPKYVKTGSGNRVAKAKFDLTETSAYYVFLDDEIHPYSPFGWLPADESEYQQYLITKSKQ